MSIEGAYSTAVNAAVESLISTHQLHVVTSAGMADSPTRACMEGSCLGRQVAVHLPSSEAVHAMLCFGWRTLHVGNTGSDACRVSPGSSPGAVTVAAVDADWSRWSNANWGPCVDLFAPGVAILSAGDGAADVEDAA